VQLTSKSNKFWAIFGSRNSRDYMVIIPVLENSPGFRIPGLTAWWTFGLSISWPGDHLDLKTGAHYCPWGWQPSYQFWYSCDVSFSSYGPTPVRLSDAPHNKTTLTLQVMSLVGDTGLRTPTVSAFPFGWYDTFDDSINQPSLVTQCQSWIYIAQSNEASRLRRNKFVFNSCRKLSLLSASSWSMSGMNSRP